MSHVPIEGSIHQERVKEPPLLTVEGISVRFAGVKALTDISFHVQPGELFAVIGPNGAGKTSLFNVLSRVYQPVSGKVTFDGRDLLQLRAYQVARVGIARTFQSLGQFPNTTVLDYLLLGRHTRMRSGILLGGLYAGMASREEKKNRAYCLHLLELLELARWRDLEPRLLLLDEPVAGMNIDETEDIAAVILDIKEQLGVTQILVEHDMALVMGIADRVLVLDFGRTIAQGVPAEVQANPDVIKAYLGEEFSIRATDDISIPADNSR